jgi:hypothetical protein
LGVVCCCCCCCFHHCWHRCCPRCERDHWKRLQIGGLTLWEPKHGRRRRCCLLFRMDWHCCCRCSGLGTCMLLCRTEQRTSTRYVKIRSKRTHGTPTSEYILCQTHVYLPLVRDVEDAGPIRLICRDPAPPRPGVRTGDLTTGGSGGCGIADFESSSLKPDDTHLNTGTLEYTCLHKHLWFIAIELTHEPNPQQRQSNPNR